MKNILNYMLVAFCLLASTSALAGRESGGGNSFLAGLIDQARQAIVFAKKKNPSFRFERQLDRIYEVALSEKLKIEESTQDLTLSGNTVDAINYPDSMRIVFSGKSLRILNYQERVRLMVHELAGLANVPDTGFSFSQQVVNIIATANSEERSYSAVQVCKDRIYKKGINYVVSEALKKNFQPLIQSNIIETNKDTKFQYGEGKVSVLKDAWFSEWDLAFEKFSTPIIVQTSDSHEVELELTTSENIGTQFRFTVLSNSLGEPIGCAIKFDEPYGGIVEVRNSYSGVLLVYKSNNSSQLYSEYPIGIEEVLGN